MALLFHSEVKISRDSALSLSPVQNDQPLLGFHRIRSRYTLPHSINQNCWSVIPCGFAQYSIDFPDCVFSILITDSRSNEYLVPLCWLNKQNPHLRVSFGFPHELPGYTVGFFPVFPFPPGFSMDRDTACMDQCTKLAGW